MTTPPDPPPTDEPPDNPFVQFGRTAEIPATPLHRGWESVSAGLRWIDRGFLSVFFALPLTFLAAVGFAVAMTVGAPSGTGPAAVSRMAAMTGGGFLTLVMLIWLVPSLFALIGRVKLTQMPEDREGGSGKSLAVLMLVLFFIPLANLAGIFLFNAFLRGVGAALGKPVLVSRARLLTVLSVIAVAKGMLSAVSTVVCIVLYQDNPVVPALVAVTGLAITGILAAVVVLMFWSAVNDTRKTLDSAIRIRGLR